MIDRSDEELVAEGRRGNSAALAELLRRHQGPVRAFLRRTSGGDAAAADDLAQEAFLTAFARLDAFRGEASLRAWLCGIAYRKARERRRGEWRRGRREAEASSVPEVIEDPRGIADRRLDVQAAFLTLGIEQRAAAALCLASDMSHAEAAAALGIPLGTLKSRLAAAKAALVRALEAYR